MDADAACPKGGEMIKSLDSELNMFFFRKENKQKHDDKKGKTHE